MSRFVAPLADLLLGASCAGCGGVAPMLCAGCREAIRPEVQSCRPSPVPRALREPVPVVVQAAGSNVDVLRRVLVQWKERSVTRLTDPLAHHLASAVVPHAADHEALALVPVPTTTRSRQARGTDLMDDLARAATRLLRDVGVDAVSGQALGHTRQTRDQSGLGASARLVNLEGAFRARSTRWLEGRDVVVVDDILTTGATVGEAVRALTAAGHRPVGVAVVAATPRIAGRRR